jgi:hypothetical protein
MFCAMRTRHVFVLFTVVTVSGCQTSRTLSERPVDPVIAGSPDQMAVSPGPGAPAPQRQDVFVREHRTVISDVPRDPDATGSLFSLDDSRSNLIVHNPLRAGMLLEIKVLTSRLPAIGDQAKSQKGSSKSGDVGAGSEGLTAALPKLEPTVAGTGPLKSFKVRLDSILPNGDGIVSVTRRSSRTGDFHEVYAKARIPAEKMIPGAELSTSDLFDVAWVDFDGVQTTERNSTAWEDEYSLRLSGFEELRSKEALAVEEGRRQIQIEKEKVGEETRRMAEERGRSAKQRDELQQKLREAEAKIAELQKGATSPLTKDQSAAPLTSPMPPASPSGTQAANGGPNAQK